MDRETLPPRPPCLMLEAMRPPLWSLLARFLVGPPARLGAVWSKRTTTCLPDIPRPARKKSCSAQRMLQCRRGGGLSPADRAAVQSLDRRETIESHKNRTPTRNLRPGRRVRASPMGASLPIARPVLQPTGKISPRHTATLVVRAGASTAPRRSRLRHSDFLIGLLRWHECALA